MEENHQNLTGVGRGVGGLHCITAHEAGREQIPIVVHILSSSSYLGIHIQFIPSRDKDKLVCLHVPLCTCRIIHKNQKHTLKL